jgi:GTP-binding protein EngB required for normal cell division
MGAVSHDLDRSALGRCLEQVAALDRVDKEACAWLQEKFADEAFNLVAVGQFKRGKSSVINALLGQALLPVGVIPLTSVVTIIRYGITASCTIVFDSGDRREVGLEMLADYVTESGNPRNTKNVSQVLIRHPSPWLESGVRLVDTPGMGSAYEHNSDVTQHYLPQADAVLFVTSADQPMSKAELDFLDGIRPYAGKIFYLLNKIDYLSPDEIGESLAFSRHAVEAALGIVPRIYPVSARGALLEKRDGVSEANAPSGFGAFEESLRIFIRQDKPKVWTQSLAGNMLRLLSQARLSLELEWTALSTPLQQLREQLKVFRAKKAEVLQAKSDYKVLLDANVRALLKNDIEKDLENFMRHEKDRIAAFVDDWYHELQHLPSRQLARALEKRIFDEVRSAYDGWFAGEEPKIAQSFDAVCGRFWSDIQKTINELLEFSATLFNVPFEASEVTGMGGSRAGPNYKFWHEPVGLETLASAIVLALPKLIGDRIVIARMRKLAVDLVDMQAGRIRYDIEERLKGNMQEFSRQLLNRIEATVSGIEMAVESGLTLRQRGETEAAARRTELLRSIDSTVAIGTRVKEIVDCRDREIPA